MAGNKADVVVIGAGISGIAAARFYLDVHPTGNLVILDQDSCVGGTWNARRSYDSFWTQWTVGAAEFSDCAMPIPPAEDTYYGLFKAKHTTNYLERYVDSRVYAGKSLRERIRFSMEVQAVTRVDGEWIIEAKGRVDGSRHALRAAKLIVASGLTSIPNMPTLAGQEEFQGPVLHQESFGSSKVLSSPEITNITVLGGGKSSADMVYEAVKAGKTVSWLLKETETTGPGNFLSPEAPGVYNNAFEAGMTRILGLIVPTFMSGYPRLTWLLNSTKYGMKLMSGLWEAIDQKMRKGGKFDRKCLQGFEKLAPHSSIFWGNSIRGFLNHADFFDVVAQHVRVYCAEIEGLGQNVILLKNGESISCDAILCGTGWRYSLTFFSQDLCRQLGLPHLLVQESTEKERWAELNAAADEKVISTFPGLANPPVHYHKTPLSTPYRLYQNIAPIAQSLSDDIAQDRSIAFVGLVCVGNHFPVVECQSMWATAYLDGKVNVPGREAQEKEVALFTSWNRLRYLSHGEEGNNLNFEALMYCDILIKDLGFNSNRKGWFKDLFRPMVMNDYAGFRGEYLKKYGGGE